jgi:hypothetical protein
MKIKHEGLNKHRLSREPLEKIYARKWAEANDRRPGMPHGTLQYLLGDDNRPLDELDQRDAEVAATVIQWLGSPVGQFFVADALREYELKADER